ncbi:MAG: SDR family NAD(P)-dependent oxidoreductase [Reyranellaceae bacterium]
MPGLAEANRLAGKVALITGAGAGIGRAAALLFARHGASIGVLDLSAAAAEETVGQIAAAGGAAMAVAADVTGEASVKAAVDRVVQRFGRLDVLYNNAGGSGARDGTVADAPSEEFWNAMRLNVFGTWLCSRYALPHIAAAGGGAIVNTSSIVALKGIAGKHAYAAAKGAIVSLTRTMAVEYAPQKIRVNAVAPSVTMTDRVKGFLQVSNRSSGLAAMHMLGLGEPEDIAAGALYLACDDSRLVTGQVLSIDSGVSIR